MIPAKGKGIVKTDLSIAIPHGTYARIAPRSGLAVKNFIDTGAGVVDEDYRGAVGALLVYDVTDRETFENVRTWIQEIEKYSKPGVCKILVGNKCDMESAR